MYLEKESSFRPSSGIKDILCPLSSAAKKISSQPYPQETQGKTEAEVLAVPYPLLLLDIYGELF